jgi:hypothetical protein
MANAVYGPGREGFATAAVNWVTDTIKVTAVDLADYTVSLSTHDFFNDVPALARVATATLASKTAALGVLDAADTTMASVTGDQFEALIFWKDTGVESTSRLLIYIDTVTTGALSLTPNGGDVQIVHASPGIVTI